MDTSPVSERPWFSGRVGGSIIGCLALLTAFSAWGQGNPEEVPDVTGRFSGAKSKQAGGDVRLLLMEFTSQGGVSQKQMDVLGDMLASIIRDLGGFTVISKADIRAALKLEEQKQLLECGEESCYAEIGGALGARWLVSGNVGMFGAAMILNLKLFDTEKMSVVASVSRKFRGGESRLADELPLVTRALMAKAFDWMQPDRQKPHELGEALGRLEAAPEESAVGFASTTLGHATFWPGVALCAFGGLAAGLSAKAADEYIANPTPEAKHRSSTWAGLMWAGLGAGATLMIAGAVFWILAPEESAASATGLTVGVARPEGGLVLQLGGRL